MEPNFDMTPTFDQQLAEINRALEWMRRVNAQRGEHLEIARIASGELAAAVWAFLDDPSGVGTDALREAYDRFMGIHAAGFTRSAWDASRPPCAERATAA